jgi:hypothetical protein
MKRHIALKRFEYCIPGFSAAFDGIRKLSIDFEKKELSLTGDIGAIPDRPRKLWRPFSTSATERIEIKATIHPGVIGALTGLSGNEVIFSLERTIRDGKRINSCSGLLVLENLPYGHGCDDREWHATLYLYDNKNDGREIKLRLTMYRPLPKPELN